MAHTHRVTATQRQKKVEIERWLPLNSFFISFSFNVIKNLFSWPVFVWFRIFGVCVCVCLFFFFLNKSQYSSPYNCLWLLSVRCGQNRRLQTKWISLQNIRIQQTISISIQIHGCVVWSASLSKIATLYCLPVASNHWNENHQTSLSLNTLTIPMERERKKTHLIPFYTLIPNRIRHRMQLSHRVFHILFPFGLLRYFFSSYCSFRLPLSHSRKTVNIFKCMH